MVIVQPMNQAIAAVDRIKDGDLAQAIEAEGQDEPAKLLRAMRDMQASLSRVVTAVRVNADCVATQGGAVVSQVGQAVAQMDQVTQQNAALVEESAAAAESLKLQAGQRVEAVAVFKLRRISA